LTLSEVTPQSMTVNGSVITSGGVPRAGGADQFRSAFMIRCGGHLLGPVLRPARRHAHRPAVVEVEQHFGDLVPRQQEDVVGSAMKSAATSTRPRSRILRQITE